MKSKKGKGAGRGRKSKWSAEQLEFLTRQFSVFESAQRTSGLPDFWPKMEREFFELWPEEDVLGIVVAEDDGSGEGPGAMGLEDAKRVGEATARRKKRLGSWFNNHSQKVKRQMDAVAPSKSGTLAAKLFKQLAKKRRRLQEVEIFQKRNKRLIDDAVKAKLAKWKKTKRSGDITSDNDSDSSDNDSSSSSDDDSSNSSSDDDSSSSDSDSNDEAGRSKNTSGSKPKMDLKARSRALRIRRKIVQKLWKKATAAEKAIVREIYTQQKAHIVDDVFDKPVEERTPEEIQSAIEELPGIVAEFHAGIYAMTGWQGVTLLGGPMPSEGGAVTQKTFCSGTSPAGLTLAESVQDWDTVIRAVGQWLKRCNPREIRKLRALDATTSPSNSSSIPVPSNSDVLPDSSMIPAKIGKNGLSKKPTKKELKAAKAAKRASAKASAELNSISVPLTAANNNTTAGGGFDNDEDFMLDSLMSFDPSNDTSMPMHQDNIPIDPVLCGGLTTTNHPVLHGGPTAADHVLNATPHPASLLSEEQSSPLVQAFGSLTTSTVKSSHVALDSAMRGFVYRPDASPASFFPPVLSTPAPTRARAASPPTPPAPAPFALSTPSAPSTSTPASTPRAPAASTPTPPARAPSTLPTSTPASTPRAPAASTPTPPAPTPSTLSTSTPVSTRGVPTTSTPTPPAPAPSMLSMSTPVSTPRGPAASTLTPPPPTVPTPFVPSTTPRASRAPVTLSTPPMVTPPPPTSFVPSSTSHAPTTPSMPVVPPRAARRPSVPVSTPRGPPGGPAVSSTPPVPAPPTPTPAPTAPASHGTPSTQLVPTPPTQTPSIPPVPTPPATVHPALSSTAFLQSRTPCNAPKAPKASAGRGGNRGRGGRARGVRGARGGGGRGATARDAGYTWLQTYDADGNTVPLPLDTVLPGPSRDEVRRIRGVEKARDEAEEAKEADAAWRKSLVHNPAGGADLVIFPPLPPPKSRKTDVDNSSLVLPQGTKRVRRPAASREMPIPLSARPVPGAADARQAKLDEELLKRLQGGTQKHGEQTGKRKRKDDSNENLAPVPKK
ncbi:hypothetical protein C8R45DRAFT_947753 [Mycena sanguinolenta]|nr:hypothetical protein C8R45DRAFT_947753 [Mycena sanguinolenta]